MTDEFLKNIRIMIVDDEEIVRDFFIEALSRRGIEPVICVDGSDAVEKLKDNPVDLVITDMRMPKMNGMELLSHIQGFYPTIPVIMLTAYASVEHAVEAMRSGAFDYLCKPVTDLKQLEVALVRAMQYRMILVENSQLKVELNGRYRFDRLVGPGEKMQRIFTMLSTVAPTQATVLIQGPSGTGKELVARAIHHNSPRVKAPFMQVNCAALPDGLIESELFGHEKGAFTGAIRTTKGKFEAANGGTILLDEIGEMPTNLQAKLLRVLQEREIQRVGSTDTVKIDVRLIATTNIDLDKAVEDGNFRQDLYYRLNVIPIKLPSLSERKDDIPFLATYFLKRYTKIHGRKAERISENAMLHLLNAPWQGNVRELENAIERAVVMSDGDQIDLKDFFMGAEAPSQIFEQAMPISTMMPVEAISIAELEKQHILRTLQVQDGHRAQTADLLGISIRTLRNKLNEYRQQGVHI